MMAHPPLRRSKPRCEARLGVDIATRLHLMLQALFRPCSATVAHREPRSNPDALLSCRTL